MATIEIRHHGASRSFSPDTSGCAWPGDANVLLLVGQDVGGRLAAIELERWSAVIVELHTECLRAHVEAGQSPSNLLGFARFVLGHGEATDLVELVRLEQSEDAATETAVAALEALGCKISICSDAPGRIVDRLLRPYLNSALWAVDEGRATAADLDRLLELGLGYPEGPIALLERTGLAEHASISEELFRAYGEQSLVPAPRARAASAAAPGDS